MIVNDIGLTKDSYSNIYTADGSEIGTIYDREGHVIYYMYRDTIGDGSRVFTSYGAPIKDYKIYGNTLQDGTPSPDMPVDVQGVGEYDYNSRTYYIPISRDAVELCDIHDIDRGTLACGITAYGYHAVSASLVNVSTQASEPNAMLIPIKSATTYQVKFKTNDTALANADYVRVALIDSFYNSRTVYDIYTWRFSSGKLLNNREYYVTMTNTDHRYIIIQSNLSPFDVFDYFSIQEALSVANIGSEPLYRIGNYADYAHYSINKIVRRVAKHILTGDEVWYTEATIEYGRVFKTIVLPNGDNRSLVPVWSTHYSPGKLILSWGANRILFIVDDRFGNSISDFKSWLAAQYAAGTPVTVWYVLKTPIEEDPPVPFPELPTLTGTNTLSIDTPVKPSEIDLTGRFKTSGYSQLLDKNLTAINDSTGTPIFIRG